jgi:ankyrin repeat protein
MNKRTAKVAILDEDDNLYQLLSKNNKSGIEFILFKDIKGAQKYIESSKVVCFLTETLVKNESSVGVVQLIKSDKTKPNYKTPIIIYSSQIDKGFISRVKSKVLAAFKKPMINEESFEKFIPLLVHIYNRKNALADHIDTLEESLSILHKNIDKFVSDENIQTHEKIDLLKQFLNDLDEKSRLFENDVSPHYDEAFQDSFSKKDLEEALLAIPLDEGDEPERSRTCENLGTYKNCQSEIQKINKSFSESFMGDPSLEDAVSEEAIHNDNSQPKNDFKKALDIDYRDQIFKAIEKNDWPTIKGLIKVKAQFNICDLDGNTPLHLICKKGNLDLLATFLEQENVTLDSINKKGHTALSIAVINNNREAASLLIERDCKLNERDGQGSTPLMIASYQGFLDIVIDLISAGAEHSLMNHNGKSALDLAYQKGHDKIVKFLKSMGTFKISS